MLRMESGFPILLWTFFLNMGDIPLSHYEYVI